MKSYTDVQDFLDDLEPARRAEVEALREIILHSAKPIAEHIKWNAPSYSHTKDDRVTLNLHDKKYIRLILHAGATVKEDKKGKPIIDDTTGLLQWISNIRATISFEDLADIKKKSSDLKKILSEWFKLLG